MLGGHGFVDEDDIISGTDEDGRVDGSPCLPKHDWLSRLDVGLEDSFGRTDILGIFSTTFKK